MPRNPWFSKPDLRKAISSVADSGLVVSRVEFRPDVILVHTERVQTALPALAAIGLADRLGSRRGKRQPRGSDTAHSVASP